MDTDKPDAQNHLQISSLIDILDIEDLQKFQDSFAQANHVASSIVDPNGIPITRPSNYSGVCRLIRETEKGRANCIYSGKTLGRLSVDTQQPSCLVCQSVGFFDAAAPIIVENVHLANWLIGQNAVGDVDEQRIIAYAEEIGGDKEAMLAAFRDMDKISEQQFREKLDFLWLMANRLSNQAYQQLKYRKMVATLEQSQRELNHYKDNLEEIVRTRTSELENAIKTIQQISMRDALTGCFNRGGIEEHLPKEMKRARRYGNPISVCICDLDHFKNINDTYGHQAGDLVLKQVVARMQELIRDDIDWLGRFGGEEFLLILPLTPIAGGAKTAERLKQAISEILFIFAGNEVRVSASFGVCGIDSWSHHDVVSHEGLLNCADRYLYQAKEGGRNLVVSGPAFP